MRGFLTNGVKPLLRQGEDDDDVRGWPELSATPMSRLFSIRSRKESKVDTRITKIEIQKRNRK